MAPGDLLQPLEGQREETLKILDALEPAQLDQVHRDSGWTVRQIFAHIARAELGEAFVINRARDGDVIHMSPDDRDQFNESGVGEAEDWDAPRVRSELEDARSALRSAFAALDEEDLDLPIRWPEWPARTIRSSIPYMLEHEDSHLDEIRSTLGHR